MRGREPIMPQRRQRIPSQFSWVDHRLVRDGHIRGRSAPALALYLFLVTVANAEGMNWYSKAVLCRHLSWGGSRLQSARAELEGVMLIAYLRPVSQVLDHSRMAIMPDRPRGSGPYIAEPALAGGVLQSLLVFAGEVHAGGGGAL